MESDDTNQNIPSNILCHYDEFLPLLRDMLMTNKDHLVVLGSKEVDKENLSILPNKNREDIYILSDIKVGHQCIVNIFTDDFLWIGDELYQRDGVFIVQKVDNDFKTDIKEKLSDYFLMQIKNIYPKYDYHKISKIDQKIKALKSKINQIKTKKETDSEIQKLNTAKNKLYGIESNNAKKRSELRKVISDFDKEDNQKALKKYPVYLENRDKIIGYELSVDYLINKRKECDNLIQKLNILKKERSILLPKDIKEQIALFEKELKNLERLKI